MNKKTLFYGLAIVFLTIFSWFLYDLYDKNKDSQAIKILNQSGMNFNKETFSEALDKAKTSHSVIMINFYSSWCNVCRRMKTEVFSNVRVNTFYNKKFINMAFNIDKEPGVSFAKKFGVEAYPTVVFLDEEGKIIQKVIGFQNVDDFLKIGQNVLNTQK